MTVNRFSNLLWFGALYCATQGALDSWDEAYELSYLSAYDVSVANIALAQTLGVLPMFVKGILSLPSDLARVRRIFIALGLILSGSMFIIKVTFNPNQSFWAYCLCLMLRNTGAAISDGAADGLIIDADVEALSGTISAWQGVGRMAGLILSTILGAVIIGEPATYAGFSGCLIFLGAWMLLSAPVAGIVKEELIPSPFGSRLVAACAYISRILTLGTDKWVAKFVEEKLGPALSTAGSTAYTAGKQALLAIGLRNRADQVGEVADNIVANPLAQGTTPNLVPAEKEVEGSHGDDVRRARLARLGVASAQASSAPVDASEDGSEGVTAPIMPHASLHIHAPAQKEKNSDELIPDAVVVASPRDTPVDTTSPGADTVDPIAEALGTKEAYLLLWRHIHRTPVAAFVAYMFFGQLSTYISSFPVVLWLQEIHDFTVGEVGYLTVVGAFGNMAGCFIAGYTFDSTKYKRLALLFASLLSGGPYLLFQIAKGKPALYAVWTLCSVGYGTLYTVQVSQMRLLADKRVAAAYSGLCMGMLAAAAAVGTYSGGLLTEYVSGGDYTICYSVGAGFCLFGAVLVPWIQAEDKEMQALKVSQRADRVRRGAARARRRSSFRRLVVQVRGKAALTDLEIEDAQADALLMNNRAPRPTTPLRRVGSSSRMIPISTS